MSDHFRNISDAFVIIGPKLGLGMGGAWARFGGLEQDKALTYKGIHYYCYVTFETKITLFDKSKGREIY
jgi:hypothetical protein